MSRAIAVLVCLIAACGGGSSDPADARPPDSAGPSAYAVCTMGVPTDCPAGYSCQIRNLVGGSTTMGYCSPPCSTDPDCGTVVGYTGPGTPSCFMPDACVLTCTADCPAGLTCLPTGGPVDVCGVAQ